MDCWGKGVSQQRPSQTGGKRRRSKGMLKALPWGEPTPGIRIRLKGHQSLYEREFESLEFLGTVFLNVNPKGI